MTKRIAIYCFFDEHGEVDRSKTYFLDGLCKHIDELLFVVNGTLNQKSRDIIEKKYTKKILVREDKGFDPWAYKTGMEHLGWDYLEKFDELLHVNDSCFGPIYPFKEMFDEMARRKVDFWGVIRHEPGDGIPMHIQTYFTCYRKKMFVSKSFKVFWKTLQDLSTYNDAAFKHEVLLTQRFQKQGFRSDVYINTEDLAWLSSCPVWYLQKKLLQRRCPLIKKRAFYFDYDLYLKADVGRSNYDAFNYIKSNTNFDISIIWDYLVKKSYVNYRKNLHLNVILPTTCAMPVEQKKIALIMHLTYEELIDEMFEYIDSMPRYADVYITTKPKTMIPIIDAKIKSMGFNKYEIRIANSRGRLESALLVTCKDIFLDKDYDYVCFAHDKKSKYLSPGTIANSFSYKCLENILKNKVFVENIVNYFECNKSLGLLYPSTPFHSIFFQFLGNEVGVHNYQILKRMKVFLGLNVEIPMQDEFVTTGSTFWCRPKALKKLFEYNWQYKHFPAEPVPHDGSILHAIERIYGYVCQDAGYYSAWVYSDYYASIEITNLFFYLRQRIKVPCIQDNVVAVDIGSFIKKVLFSIKCFLQKIKLWPFVKILANILKFTIIKLQKLFGVNKISRIKKVSRLKNIVINIYKK